MIGAESMLQSSFTLCNGLHDLPTLLNTVQGIMQYYDRTRDKASYESNRNFADRKSKEYMLQIQEAQQNSLHQTIMQCQGFG